MVFGIFGIHFLPPEESIGPPPADEATIPPTSANRRGKQRAEVPQAEVTPAVGGMRVSFTRLPQGRGKQPSAGLDASSAMGGRQKKGGGGGKKKKGGGGGKQKKGGGEDVVMRANHDGSGRGKAMALEPPDEFLWLMRGHELPYHLSLPPSPQPTLACLLYPSPGFTPYQVRTLTAPHICIIT